VSKYIPNQLRCKDCGVEYSTRSLTPRRALLRLCDRCWKARIQLVEARESGAVSTEQYEACQKALARHNGKGLAYIEHVLGEEATDE
jgi:arginyl-tRNA--protein-N-Asp/Glu arginylyltransferase